MKTLPRTCAVAGCTVLLLASTGGALPQAALPQAASVTVPEQGTLVAGGAGVTLPVTFDCQAGWTGGVSAEAAQTVQGHRLATGGSFPAEVDCAEGQESVEITVMGAGGFSFTDGEALVRVSLFSCDANGETCDNVDAAGVVQFVEDADR